MPAIYARSPPMISDGCRNKYAVISNFSNNPTKFSKNHDMYGRVLFPIVQATNAISTFHPFYFRDNLRAVIIFSSYFIFNEILQIYLCWLKHREISWIFALSAFLRTSHIRARRSQINSVVRFFKYRFSFFLKGFPRMRIYYILKLISFFFFLKIMFKLLK